MKKPIKTLKTKAEDDVRNKHNQSTKEFKTAGEYQSLISSKNANSRKNWKTSKASLIGQKSVSTPKGVSKTKVLINLDSTTSPKMDSIEERENINETGLKEQLMSPS